MMPASEMALMRDLITFLRFEKHAVHEPCACHSCAYLDLVQFHDSAIDTLGDKDHIIGHGLAEIIMGQVEQTRTPLCDISI